VRRVQELAQRLNRGKQLELHSQLENLLKNHQAKPDSILPEHARHLSGHEAQMKLKEAELLKQVTRMKMNASFLEALEDQLERDGFLKQGKQLSFRMENGQLFINDQLQPAEVFRKYQQLILEQGREFGDKTPEDKDFRLNLKLTD
jgi:hypothetical protein